MRPNSQLSCALDPREAIVMILWGVLSSSLSGSNNKCIQFHSVRRHFPNSNVHVTVYAKTISSTVESCSMYITELTSIVESCSMINFTSWQLDQGGLFSTPRVLWRWYLSCCNMFLKHAPENSIRVLFSG